MEEDNDGTNPVRPNFEGQSESEYGINTEQGRATGTITNIVDASFQSQPGPSEQNDVLSRKREQNDEAGEYFEEEDIEPDTKRKSQKKPTTKQGVLEE